MVHLSKVDQYVLRGLFDIEKEEHMEPVLPIDGGLGGNNVLIIAPVSQWRLGLLWQMWEIKNV